MIDRLIKKGVTIPVPESTDIGPEVDPDRISGDRVVFHAGTKLFGKKTIVCAGTELGREGPVTVEDCHIGPEVRLKGGYFKEAVFLKGASAGMGAHVREGTILEEYASVAHTVGLKQTILFPYVTLGSLINFCDCLMAGGTGPDNHSEVGSAYIHFNFTPNQDKATPSLIGDVPHGVMMDQPPIFLGGQGGIVGPCRIAYGTVIAAGTINRKDILEPNFLVLGDRMGKGGKLPYRPGRYSGVRRILKNNLIYMANLAAMLNWAVHVRALFISDGYPSELHQGFVAAIQAAIAERFRRLGQFAEKTGAAISKSLLEAAEKRFADPLEFQGHTGIRDRFLEAVMSAMNDREDRSYLYVIQSIPKPMKTVGSEWLTGIVEDIVEDVLAADPALS
jgi:UDP-N-acetylglucosamine/UDP-N-acetylgalactosamine diphosphorylase